MSDDGVNSRLPLDGVVVVAIEQAVAVPFATRQLADLGARVIKVERPATGDFARDYDHAVGGVSAYFAWLNRSKESIEIDLKEPRDLETVRQLIDRADVFVQNLAPGATERLGLDAPTLRERNPRLIVCDLSGYGAGGPYGTKKAYDLLIQAETGLLSITGTEDTPCKAGISVADISGGMYAFSGILTALYRREVTGVGATLELSLFDGLAEWMMQPWYSARYGSGAPPRKAASHASIAPYGPFSTADGTVLLAVQNEREWKAFCSTVLLRPTLAQDGRFASNPARVLASDELGELIESVFSSLSVDQVQARLDAADVASAVEREPGELREHPQLLARERWRQVESPGGTFEALLPPISLDGQEPRMDPVPGLGEHNSAVREWLLTRGSDPQGH
jgi:itaconate CoA-transferase